MTTTAELWTRLGSGPAKLVTPARTPSLAVYIGADLHELAGPHPTGLPRIDAACIRTELGHVQTRVLTGVPAASPMPPAMPAGWILVATIHIAPYAAAVWENNITEVRP